MIRKAVIAILLLLTLATVSAGVAAWNRDVVLWEKGRDKVEEVLMRLRSNDHADPTGRPIVTSLALSGGYLIWQREYWFSGIEPSSCRPSGRRDWLICRWDIAWVKAHSLQLLGPDNMTSASSSITILRRGTNIDVASWFLFALFCVYPTVAFVHGPYRRYRRRKKGLCLKCGYNLTGNVSGVCPECGEKK